MDPSAWYWLAWLLVAFLPRELWAALATPSRRDTLSEFVWFCFGVRPCADGRFVRWARARRAVLAAFLGALTGHLVMGWTVVPVIVFGCGVGLVLFRAVIFERKRT